MFDRDYNAGLNTTPGMWQMLSDILAAQHEMLPRSLNEAIYRLCAGEAELIGKKPINCAKDTPIEKLDFEIFKSLRVERIYIEGTWVKSGKPFIRCKELKDESVGQFYMKVGDTLNLDYTLKIEEND